MKKRTFIKTGSILAAGSLIAPLASCENTSSKKETSATADTGMSGKKVVEERFSLPALSYDHTELEPQIDARTMQIHHGKHHAGYVTKLNKALEGHALADKSLVDILTNISDSDSDIAVRNNGGGHYNHSLFWKVMKPGGAPLPAGKLADAITSTFSSLEGFSNAFADAAATRFGSGWAWLAVDAAGKLFVTSTANQDNPLMANIAEEKGTPILGIDVWEHAYYLKYQNKRKEYIGKFMQIINWDEVAKNYDAIG